VILNVYLHRRRFPYSAVSYPAVVCWLSLLFFISARY
jgi:hypothetical protein